MSDFSHLEGRKTENSSLSTRLGSWWRCEELWSLWTNFLCHCQKGLSHLLSSTFWPFHYSFVVFFYNIVGVQYDFTFISASLSKVWQNFLCILFIKNCTTSPWIRVYNSSTCLWSMLQSLKSQRQTQRFWLLRSSSLKEKREITRNLYELQRRLSLWVNIMSAIFLSILSFRTCSILVYIHSPSTYILILFIIYFASTSTSLNSGVHDWCFVLIWKVIELHPTNFVFFSDTKKLINNLLLLSYVSFSFHFISFHFLNIT